VFSGFEVGTGINTTNFKESHDCALTEMISKISDEAIVDCYPFSVATFEKILRL
jgi:hypothetical protein